MRYDDIIREHGSTSEDMFGPEMEAHLQNIEANGLDATTATLRRLRDTIRSRRATGDRWAQTEWVARHEAIQDAARGVKVCSGMPAAAAECLRNGFDESREACQKLDAIKDYDRVICLSGKSGHGKTVAACWWMSNQPLGGRFVLATHVAALSEKMTSDRDQLYAIQRAQALVIDDLGRGAESQSDVKKLGDLICERADNRLPTVCTTLTVPNYGVSVIRRTRILTV